MTSCQELDLLLPLHASGGLEPAEAAKVEAHLAACAACRAEAARDAEVLSLAKLPPPSEAERRALADVPRRALAELHRADGRRARAKRYLAGAAAIAAALLAIVAPAFLGRGPAIAPAELAAGASAEPQWEEPDLDRLWSDAALVDVVTPWATSSGDSDAASGDGGDAALAALEL